DADAGAGLDAPGIPRRLDRTLPELLDVGALRDAQGDDAPLDRHLPPGVLVMREPEDGTARAQTRHRGGGPAAESWNEDRGRLEHLGEVAGAVRHRLADCRLFLSLGQL